MFHLHEEMRYARLLECGKDQSIIKGMGFAELFQDEYDALCRCISHQVQQLPAGIV